MSDDHIDDPERRIFRAALPGWQSVISRPPPESDLFAPGRGWLELSILSAAVAILVPVMVLVAVMAAWSARRAGNRRARVALVAALWCAGLGLALRVMLRLPIVA